MPLMEEQTSGSVAKGALLDALLHELEATLLLRLITEHADYSLPSDVVLVIVSVRLDQSLNRTQID